MRPVLFALGAVALTACGAKDPIPSAQEDTPPLYNYNSIKTAMAEAAPTLDVFWAHFENPGAGEDGFRVKIAHESDEYLRDYVWVEYLQKDGGPGNWRGVVSLENGGNDRFTTGQTLSFVEADIIEWAYTDNGKIRGSYTTRAMLSLTDADTSALRARYHESPTP